MQFIKTSDGMYVVWDAWGPSGVNKWEFRIGSQAVAIYDTEAEAQEAVDRAAEAVGDVYEL